jgi:hypothetical protein
VDAFCHWGETRSLGAKDRLQLALGAQFDIWKRLKGSKEELYMKIFYSPSYTIAAHSFETTRKSGWIAESLAREPIAGIELVAPEPTSAAALSRVHDPLRG